MNTNKLFEQWLISNNLSENEFDKLASGHCKNIDKHLIADSELWIDKLHENIDLEITLATDYDADGVMSAIILRDAITFITNNRPNVYAPRENEGYGWTKGSIDRIYQEFPNSQLLISADSGISCKEAVDYAVDNYFAKVLISDHHEAKLELFPDKALAAVNVNRADKKDSYGEIFGGISGATTAFYLMQLYAEKYCDEQTQEKINSLKYYAAISVMSDVMPVVDENRILVKDLLEDFNSGKMLEMSSSNDSLLRLVTFLRYFGKQLTITDFGFSVIPLINSNRRMTGESSEAMKLFSYDELEAYIAYVTLKDLNDQRKAKLKQAVKDLNEIYDFSESHGAAFKVELGSGLLGLLASRVANANYIPALAFSSNEKDGFIGASGRGVESKSVMQVLQSIQENRNDLTFTFGGHSMALGCRVLAKDFDDFKDEFESTSKKLYSQVAKPKSKAIILDRLLDLDEAFATAKRISIINPLPYGISNLQAKLPIAKDRLKFFGREKEHAKMFYVYDGQTIEMLNFFKSSEFAESQEDFDAVINVSYENNTYFASIEAFERRINAS